MLRRVLAGLLLTTVLATPALAQDWMVAKLRGTAEVLTDGVWTPLKRGDVLSGKREVRTLANSRIELVDGAETISLDPDTQAAIEDLLDGTQEKTIVHQSFGTVEIEAETKTTDHLTVETRFMAAVVKGTHFIVTANDAGASVQVTRGLVAVKAADTEQTTSVEAGNTAHVEAGAGQLWVTGTAPAPKIYDRTGAEIAMPTMPVTAEIKRPAANVALAEDVAAEPPLQVAEATPSAGIALPVAIDAASEAAPVAKQSGGLDFMTALIGVAIGVMVGAVALLLRRVFR